MVMQRLLIKGGGGNLYRLCRFAYNTDGKNEGYIKFSFPDFKNRQGFSSGIPIDQGVIEFSYHFEGGVSHFKTTQGNYPLQKKGLIQLKDTTLMHLFSCSIFDLSNLKVFKKQKALHDLELKDNFNKNKGKLIEFYLGHAVKNAIVPEIRANHLNCENLKLHPYSNGKVRLLIVELDYKKNPEKSNGITIFRPDKPEVSFTEFKQ